MPSPVIDLSHHNPTPDWAKLKGGGVAGVIHKATESYNYTDPMLFKRAKAAMDAGLLWSTYHFLRPGSMEDQIAFYLKTIDPVPGERVCLDFEDDDMTLDELRQAVQLLQADPRDLQVTIYSGNTIKDKLGDAHDPILATTSLWIAQYTSGSAPSWPTATWPTWSLWQWTDRETIPGISSPVDGNRWNGDSASLLVWFGPAGAEPAPTPEPATQTLVYKLTVTAPAGDVSIEVEQQS